MYLIPRQLGCGVIHLERVLFIDQADDVGFSILKEYPSNSLFKPAKNKNGQDDDVVMIRIAFNKKEIDKPTKRLFIDVVKVSRYKLKNNFVIGNIFEAHNKENDEFPTEESIKVSLKSIQPENLNFKNVTLKENVEFFDEDDDGKFEGLELIKFVYDKHISTCKVSIPMFRIKLHKILLRVLEYIGNLFLYLHNSAYVNKNDKANKDKDFFTFYWKSTKYLNDPREKLTDSEMKYKPCYAPLSYSDLKIYPIWTITFSSVIIYLFYLNESLNTNIILYGFLKVPANFIITHSSNNLFFTTLIALFLAISNYYKYLLSWPIYMILRIILGFYSGPFIKIYHKFLWKKIKV